MTPAMSEPHTIECMRSGVTVCTCEPKVVPEYALKCDRYAYNPDHHGPVGMILHRHGGWRRNSDYEILAARVAELENGHCRDCCCARAWNALGIYEFSGASIPEEIDKLKAEIKRLRDEVEQLKKDLDADFEKGEGE